MTINFEWTITGITNHQAAFDADGDFYISTGSLAISANAEITNPEPVDTAQNMRFGYLQNVLASEITWFYNDGQCKTVKSIAAPHLDQEPHRADFFFNTPRSLNAYTGQVTRFNFPHFRDDPRTYGVQEDFYRLTGRKSFSLAAIAYNVASHTTKVLAHCFWEINYDSRIDSHQNIIAGAGTNVRVFQAPSAIEQIMAANQLRRTGPTANDPIVQQINHYERQGDQWVLEVDDTSSSGSSDGSEGSLEVEEIDQSKLVAPPWFNQNR